MKFSVMAESAFVIEGYAEVLEAWNYEGDEEEEREEFVDV